jgi:hypothetical protein
VIIEVEDEAEQIDALLHDLTVSSALVSRVMDGLDD